MRFVVGLALLGLSSLATPVFADDTRPAEPKPETVQPRAKVPLRLVRILSDGKEALLFDRVKMGHVLAELGATIEGYTVVAIDEDELTLELDGVQTVLAEPVPERPRHDDRPAPVAAKKKGEPAPVDPYASDKPAAPVDPYAKPDAPPAKGPVDPYADPPIHVVEAPSAPAEVHVVEAPKPSPIVATPAPAPTVTPAPATTVTPPVADGALVLDKHEVQIALADFGKLASGVRGAFVPAGVRLDGVAAGSLFAKAGLRAGDVVAQVDGQPLRSIDDAADLYARAATARNVTVQVIRSGKPTMLRLSIQ